VVNFDSSDQLIGSIPIKVFNVEKRQIHGRLET